MRTKQKKGLKKIRIPATWYFAIGFFLCLNPSAWCGTIDSLIHKAPIPLHLPLSGTVNGDQYQKGSTIESTQVIERGKTTYLAEDEVVLRDGFELKDGAEFEVLLNRDSFHIVTMLTYNVWGDHTDYTEHAKIIKNSKADVVSVQEVKKVSNFNKLLEESGYHGEMSVTIDILIKYGIALLWNPNTLDSPDIDCQLIDIPKDKDADKKRAYMVAEFRDFCFIATHYSSDKDYRKVMTYSILNNQSVQRCKDAKKPIYIAGDMNEQPHHKNALPIFEESGFKMLNSQDYTIINESYKYADSTRNGGAMIDLILEYNQTPYHRTLESGVPIPADQRQQFFIDKTSDHLPYRVRVKVK